MNHIHVASYLTWPTANFTVLFFRIDTCAWWFSSAVYRSSYSLYRVLVQPWPMNLPILLTGVKGRRLNYLLLTLTCFVKRLCCNIYYNLAIWLYFNCNFWFPFFSFLVTYHSTVFNPIIYNCNFWYVLLWNE